MYRGVVPSIGEQRQGAELSCTSVQCAAEQQRQQRSNGQGRERQKRGWRGQHRQSVWCEATQATQTCQLPAGGHSVGWRRRSSRRRGASGAKQRLLPPPLCSFSMGWCEPCKPQAWEAQGRERLVAGGEGSLIKARLRPPSLDLALQAARIALGQDGADRLVRSIIQVAATGGKGRTQNSPVHTGSWAGWSTPPCAHISRSLPRVARGRSKAAGKVLRVGRACTQHCKETACSSEVQLLTRMWALNLYATAAASAPGGDQIEARGAQDLLAPLHVGALQPHNQRHVDAHLR